MALTIDLKPIKITGDEEDAQKTLTVILKVTSDGADKATIDGELSPVNIYNALDAAEVDSVKVFKPGATYTGFGSGDSADSSLKLRRRSVGDRAETSDTEECYRPVNLEYKQQVISLQANKNQSVAPPYEDQDSYNPLDWEAEVRIDQIPHEYEPPTLKFKGFFNAAGTTPISVVDASLLSVDNKACAMTPGNYYPIQTSAAQPIPNAAKFIYYTQRITIIERVENIADTIIADEMRLANFVNDRRLRLNKPKQHINWVFEPGTLRFDVVKPEIKRVTWNDGTDQEQVYWEKRYQFEYNANGWNIDLLNMGTVKTPIQGEAKDENGRVLDATAFGNIANGGASPVPIADAKDKSQDAVMLDRDGRPATGEVNAMRYGYDEGDFLKNQTPAPVPDERPKLNVSLEVVT